MASMLVALRWFIGTVFLIAVLMKIRPSAWSDFTATVRALVGRVSIRALPIAVGVTVAEAACAVLLATHAVAGFAVALSLFLAMIGAIVVTVRRKVEITCPCFGASSTPLGVRHVARNSVLAVAALAGLLGAIGPSLQPSTSGTVIAAAAGILAAVVVAMLERIIDLFTDETSVTKTANRSNA